MQKFDLIILGGGASAFAASTRANELGAKTAMINAGLPLGGTCVNVGCVPTKNLLEVSNHYYYSQHPHFGSIQSGQARFDFKKAIEEKNTLIGELRQANYLNVLESQPNVILFQGRGEFVSQNQVKVNDQILTAEKFIIATGSSTNIIPFQGIDEVNYLTHKEALQLSEPPESMLVIGGGPLGLEFAQMFAHFGSRVTVIEITPQILPQSDPTISKELRRCLEEEVIEIHTRVQTKRLRQEGKYKIAEVKVDGKIREFRGQQLLMATGVVGNVKDMGLEKVKVKTDHGRYIKVDGSYRTSAENIWAAGDVIGPPFLEAVAAKEGYLAVGNALNGESKSINYLEVPYAVFTSPQVAGVGMSEEEYMRRFGTCYCRTVYMNQVPKALAVRDTRGVIKMTAHHETHKIMGVEMVAPLAADMIHEAALAVKFGLTIEDIIDTVHVFPTFSEAIKLVAQSFTRDLTKMSCCVV